MSDTEKQIEKAKIWCDNITEILKAMEDLEINPRHNILLKIGHIDSEVAELKELYGQVIT